VVQVIRRCLTWEERDANFGLECRLLGHSGELVVEEVDCLEALAVTHMV